VKVHLFFRDGEYLASSNDIMPSFYKNKDDKFVESTNRQRRILSSRDKEDFFRKLANKEYMNSIIE
jgi:hypothetical protein